MKITEMFNMNANIRVVKQITSKHPSGSHVGTL